MRSIFAAALVAVASLGFVACAADTGHETDEELVDAQGNTITKADATLVAAYDVSPGSSWDYNTLVLRNDGSYFAETIVECLRYPCPPLRETGTWTSTDFSHGQTSGSLALKPAGHSKRKYTVGLAADGSGFKLTRAGVTTKFDKVQNYCDDSFDCAGQNVPVYRHLCPVGTNFQNVCRTETHRCDSLCESTKPCQVSGCGVYCGEDTQVCNKLLKNGVKQCYANTGHCGRAEDGTCKWLNQESIDACLDNLP